MIEIWLPLVCTGIGMSILCVIAVYVFDRR